MKKLILILILFSNSIQSKSQDTSSVNYWNRAGITDSVERYAIDEFVDSLKVQGFWSKAKVIYLVSPTCYGAAVNNLINSSYQLYGANCPNYSPISFDFNGVNQHLKTGFNPSTSLTTNDYTIVERCLNSTTGGIDGGSSGSTTNQLYTYITTTQARIDAYSNASVLNGTTTTGIGNYFFSVHPSGTPIREIRKNKTSVITSNTALSGTIPNLEFYLGALNNNGIVSNWALRLIQFYGIFSSALSHTESDKLSDDIDKFESKVIVGGR